MGNETQAGQAVSLTKPGPMCDTFLAQLMILVDSEDPWGQGDPESSKEDSVLQMNPR